MVEGLSAQQAPRGNTQQPDRNALSNVSEDTLMEYVLVLTVCSLVQGASCRTLSPMPLIEGAGLMGCMIASQIEGAKWSQAHPNFYVSRAACRPPSSVFAKT